MKYGVLLGLLLLLSVVTAQKIMDIKPVGDTVGISYDYILKVVDANIQTNTVTFDIYRYGLFILSFNTSVNETRTIFLKTNENCDRILTVIVYNILPQYEFNKTAVTFSHEVNTGNCVSPQLNPERVKQATKLRI